MVTNNSSNYSPVQYNTQTGGPNGTLNNVVPGTSGQVFTSNGASTQPSFQNVTTSGTFTPGIAFGGASTGITYANQLGEYTTIGNTVHFNIIITLSSKGSSTGAASVTGFPVATSAAIAQSIAIAATNNITYTANFTNSYLNTSGTSGTNFFLFEFGAVGGVQALTNTNFANNSQIFMSGFYFIN